MAKPAASGLRRIVRAARFSAQGLRHAWRHEAAFRQEVFLVCALLPAAFWLGQTATARAALIASLVLVLIVELLNSAIEAAIDRHGDEQHELSGRAKDMASAAVLLSLLLVVLVWAAVAWQRFGAG